MRIRPLLRSQSNGIPVHSIFGQTHWKQTQTTKYWKRVCYKKEAQILRLIPFLQLSCLGKFFLKPFLRPLLLYRKIRLLWKLFLGCLRHILSFCYKTILVLVIGYNCSDILISLTITDDFSVVFISKWDLWNVITIMGWQN